MKPDLPRLGPYLIDGPLADGTSSRVLSGREFASVPYPRYAIKVPHDACQATAAAREAVLRAAAELGGIRHPNVARVYGGGETNGQAWVALDEIPGRNLQTTLDTLAELRRPLRPRLALTIAARVAEGLAALTLRDPAWTHGALRPSKVVLSWSGDVVLLPVSTTGIDQLGRLSPTDPTTLGWLSPEQLRGDTAVPQTDVRALALLVLALLGRRHPFRATRPAEAIAAVLRAPGVDTRAFPTGLRGLLHRSLLAEPDQRPDCAEAVLAALGPTLAELGGAAPPSELEQLLGEIYPEPVRAAPRRRAA